MSVLINTITNDNRVSVREWEKTQVRSNYKQSSSYAVTIHPWKLHHQPAQDITDSDRKFQNLIWNLIDFKTQETFSFSVKTSRKRWPALNPSPTPSSFLSEGFLEALTEWKGLH